ncbi:PAS domain S-box protein [Segetibacter sp. 3557_3]|uniref:sensor histidine kinase n=1 Tax=Segetibacter sp. 3557_3 TaxID=2547429 RepID=UPI001058553B|nr:ATP-binding protein [Segetibacter sp. 3557_3]TDH25141.1 PAS domain S-box protein [Segetibacter sp. 3557_3]
MEGGKEIGEVSTAAKNAVAYGAFRGSRQPRLFGNWQWCIDEAHVYCSAGLLQLYGIVPGGEHHISSTAFLEFVHPAFRDLFNQQLTLAEESGEALFEYKVISPSGEEKTIGCWMGSVNERGGRVTIAGNCWDVSRLHRVDTGTQPEPSHTHAEAVAKLASWQWNFRLQELTLSPNFFALLALDRDHFELSYKSFIALIQIEDRFNMLPVFEQGTVENGAFELRMIKHSNTLVYVKCMFETIQSESGDPVIVGTLQDISDEVELRRELEEKKLFAELLFDTSIDLISAYDQKTRVIAWNKTCEERYGIKKEDAIGREVVALFPNMEGDPWLHNLTRALEGEIIFQTNQTSSSLEGHFDYYLLPLIADGGDILGALSISHDLTEMRNVTKRLDELNRTLEEKNEELERSNNELASFSYVASHDLQEPLRKIQTFSQRISETEVANLSENGKEYLKRMESAAKRMQALIEDLLTFSRTNTALKDLEATDLNKMAEEVKAAFKDVIEEKSAQVEIVDLPVARVIPFQFRQLLENLLSNALKYSKVDEQPRIVIRSELFTGVQIKLHGVNINKKYYKITVTDNGIGFEQQYAEKIFELFQRLHGKHDYPGSGLGLSICKKIIQNHHGFISAKGEPQKGATFTIYLPE